MDMVLLWWVMDAVRRNAPPSPCRYAWLYLRRMCMTVGMNISEERVREGVAGRDSFRWIESQHFAQQVNADRREGGD